MTEGYKKVSITCETVKEVSVYELSRFFYYLNNIYKIIYFQETKKEKELKFYYRRKLNDKERLRTSVIKKESPLEFIILIPLIFGGASATKKFVETVKLIRDWKLDRKIKELTAEQLRSQNELLRKEINKITKLKEITVISVIEEEQFGSR